MIRLMWL